MSEIRADPAELARVAQSYLDTSQDLGRDLRSGRADSVLGQGDFGNVADAGALLAAYDGAAEAAGGAIEQLVAVLEVDNESLLRVAFSYQEADEDAARKLRRQHRNIPI
jgi:hypothetical protein